MAQLTAAAKPNSWQDTCSRALLDCVRKEVNKAGAGRSLWALKRRAFAEQQRVILADIDLKGAALRGFDFRYCYIVRCDFAECDLTGTDFRATMMRRVHFTRANLSGVNLNGADLSSDCNLHALHFDDESQFDLAGDISEENRAGPALKQRIDDHRYVGDVRRLTRSPLGKIWNFVTDYGRSIKRLVLVSIGINAVFTLLYGFIHWLAPERLPSPSSQTALEMLLLSFQKFLNTTSPIESSDLLVNAVFVVHVTIGLAALGIFVALLSKRLVASLR
ncbi:MAG: pentapeptide repeat-containing protein [Alphaproteobacteria bacterium]